MAASSLTWSRTRNWSRPWADSFTCSDTASTTGSATEDELFLVDCRGYNWITVNYFENLDEAGSLKFYLSNQETLTGGGAYLETDRFVQYGETITISGDDIGNTDIAYPGGWLLIVGSKTSAGAGSGQFTFDLAGGK